MAASLMHGTPPVSLSWAACRCCDGTVPLPCCLGHIYHSSIQESLLQVANRPVYAQGRSSGQPTGQGIQPQKPFQNFKSISMASNVWHTNRLHVEQLTACWKLFVTLSCAQSMAAKNGHADGLQAKLCVFARHTSTLLTSYYKGSCLQRALTWQRPAIIKEAPQTPLLVLVPHTTSCPASASALRVA